MKRSYGIAFSKSWPVLLVFLFPMLSCTTIQQAIFPPTITPTATPTSTPTPTSIPIASRDLSEIALQQSDLPGGFEENVVPDVKETYAQSGSSIADDILRNLETGYGVVFISGSNTLYINLIFVYTDAGSAKDAYDAYVGSVASDFLVEVPVIGEESTGLTDTSSEVTTYVIFWRYHEALVELDYFGSDDIGMDEVVRLARIVQSRLEAG